MMNRLSICILVFAIACTSTGVAGSKKKPPQQSKELQTTLLKAAAENAISPREGQTVIVHYTGWLNDHGKPGKKFDSSLDRGTPFSFVLGRNQVIQGWELGLKTMKVGEKRRLFIPSSLGYGSRGVGAIPPNADLIFDVELVSVR